MLKISIPTPCHEDWNQMTPNQQGRHCDSCMKTVVDFTSMSDEQVQHFLINNQQEHSCGRFTSRQLQTIQVELPPDIFIIQMPLWKQFLAACLIVFATTLFSCEVKHPDPLRAFKAGVELENKIPGLALRDPSCSPGRVGLYFSKEEYTAITPVMDTSVLMGVPIIDEPVIYGGFTAGVPICADTTIAVNDSILPITGTMKYVPADSIPKIPEQKIFKGKMKFTPQPPKDSVDCKNFS